MKLDLEVRMFGKAWICAVLGAMALLCALPAAAGASVYCIDTTPGNLADNDSIDPSCETPATTLTTGLEAASSHPGEDSVLVGPGSYTLPVGAGSYETTYDSTDALHLRGIGDPQLTMGSTQGSQVGIRVAAGAGSTIEGLGVTVPANADGTLDRAFFLSGAEGAPVLARDLHVDGPAAVNAQGFYLFEGVTLADSDAQFPVGATDYDIGAFLSGGGVHLEGDLLEAELGVVVAGGTGTIDRSEIHAWTGASTDDGNVVLRDSLLRLQGRDGAIGLRLANENNSNATITGTVEGTTIVGGEGFDTAGVRVMANQNEETAAVTITGTVISGPKEALEVWSDAGREAKANVSYSDYDPMRVEIKQDLDGVGAPGKSVYTATNDLNVAPGFLDAAGGDYRLAAGSALIDVGDPVAPAAGRLDLAGGQRALAGACGGAARGDIGAYEFAPTGCAPAGGGGEVGGPGNPGTGGPEVPSGGTPGGSGTPPSSGGNPGTPPAGTPQLPDTTIRIAGGRRLVRAARKTAKVTVAVGSNVPGAGFSCRVDAGPARPCGPRTTLRLRPGKHTIAAAAVTAAGADPTPATVIVTVVRKAGHR